MILVVDDTPSNIDIILSIIGDDYEVAVALSGEDALEILEEEKPDLILLDIVMPGMDGYEVCSKIKENQELKDIHVVFLSGNSTDEDIKKSKILGASGFLSKPIDPDKLLSTIKEYV